MTTMSQPHILLLGANGNIAKLMIPRFLAKSWSVTALIRNPDHTKAIKALKADNPGTLDVIVHSLADVKTSKDAASVIAKAKGVNWIVWSAGAGGKADTPEARKAQTEAIDRQAAIAFAHAATHNKSIQRYLTISWSSARRNYETSWWSAEEVEDVKKQSGGGMEVYHKAKRDADECLTVWGDERRETDKAFNYVVLRPGLLSNNEGTGKIQLGRTTGTDKDSVPRDDVAEAAVQLLETGANGWIDILGGEEPIKSAVERVVAGGDRYTSIEGELKETREATAKKALASL